MRDPVPCRPFCRAALAADLGRLLAAHRRRASERDSVVLVPGPPTARRAAGAWEARQRAEEISADLAGDPCAP